MAGNLGSLLVDIGASTARLERDLSKARQDMTAWGRSMSRIATGVGAAIAGAISVSAFTGMVKGTLDAADSMAKLSQSTGVAVEDLTAYRHAAELSGTNVETVAQSLGRLSKNMADTARDTGQARESFRALGIAVVNSDGALRSSDEVMGDIADRFASMQDGAQKSALAMEIFGRSGTQLIPMLNQGRGGLEEMRKEAARLGLVLSTETAQAAERINDNFTRLNGAIRGARTNIVAGMLPTLENLTNMMVEASSSTDDMAAASETLSTALKLLASGGLIVGNVFNTTGRILGGVAAALVSVAQREFRQAGAILSELASDVRTDWDSGVERLKQVWSDAAEAAQQSGRKIAEGFKPVIESAKDDSAAQRIKAVVDALRFEVDQLGRSSQDQEIYNRLRMAGIDINHQAAQSIAEMVKKLQDHASAEDAARMAHEARVALMAQGSSVTQSVMTNSERLAQEIERLDHLLQEGAISWETYSRASAQAAENFSEKTKEKVQETGSQLDQFAIQAARNMQTAFADFLFDPFDQGVKGMLEGFGDAVRRMVAEIAAQKMLSALFGGMSGSSTGWVAAIGKAFANEKGNAFHRGAMVPFARGGVVSSPTTFPMSAGRTGLMGEAGPEAIMPLKRTPGGNLGVEVSGAGGSVVNNNININVDARGADSGVSQQIEAGVRRAVSEAYQRVLADARSAGPIRKALA